MIARRLGAATVSLCCVFVVVGGLRAGPPEGESQMRQLVRGLGDREYEVRERAAQQLTRSGARAKPALLEALRDPDLEVRLRAHEILLTILRDDFDSRLEAFLEDPKGLDVADFPAWERFSQRFGSERPVRELYTTMLRTEAALLEACDAPEADLQRAVGERVESLYASNFVSRRRAVEVSPATLACLLFVASERSSDLMHNPVIGNQVANRLYMLLELPAAKQSILHGSQSVLMRKVLEGWASQEASGVGAYYALMTCLNYELKDAGLRLARQLVRSDDLFMPNPQYAAIVLARFGGAADMQLLEPLLKNKNVCHSWSNPQIQPEPIQIQVRDVALAMLIHLSGQDPKDYGFKLIERNPTTVFHIYTCCFRHDDERDVALKKWQAWRDAQPH